MLFARLFLHKNLRKSSFFEKMIKNFANIVFLLDKCKFFVYNLKWTVSKNERVRYTK